MTEFNLDMKSDLSIPAESVIDVVIRYIEIITERCGKEPESLNLHWAAYDDLDKSICYIYKRAGVEEPVSLKTLTVMGVRIVRDTESFDKA